MEYLQRINAFAIKWLEKFRNPDINYLELVDHWLADDCKDLGFKMDSGKAFYENYGDALGNYEELSKIIDSMMDIDLLGSAVYSKWRYFNHWAFDGSEILEPQNRQWFVLAFVRLKQLSRLNARIFSGELQKVRIVSNNLSYGPIPDPEEEVEQHLIIDKKGLINFSGYNFGDGGEISRTKDFEIDKTKVEILFNAFTGYFSKKYEEIFATDIGTWDLKLINTEGETYFYHGSLCAHLEYEDTDLSDLVRETTEMDELDVFDGNDKPDVITKITIDYHRITKIKPKDVPQNTSWEYATWDYTEHLCIDRETETMEHILNIGTGCKISHKYEIEGGVVSLLDNFDADELFYHIEGNPDDVVENPNETKNYKITIDYKNNPQRIIEGSFDKMGLPKDYSYFAVTSKEFLRFYGFGELFDSMLYGRAKRRQSEYIFCSVFFEEGYNSYYYLTDDENIQIGDYVLVPAGTDNHEAVVEVIDVEFFSEEDAPYPVEKTKRIIRKCTDDDFK